MSFLRTKIPDVIEYTPKVFGDDRGYFFESFRLDHWEDFLGRSLKICQSNESKSKYGVLRGLHFQQPPFAQSKLVRVVSGKILDIAVDLRIGSPTYAQHVRVFLSADNKKQLFIPKGFAHGFVVLSKEAVFSYNVDQYYHKESDSGISFSDSILNIDWELPQEDLIISEKDLNQKKLSESSILFKYGGNE